MWTAIWNRRRRARTATVGLLDGGLAGSIYRGFKGKLLKGVIRQPAVAADAVLDGHGDPTAAGTRDIKIEGFTEGYSRFTRAQAGIPATDLKLNIFAASAPGTTPAIDNLARLDRKAGGRTTSQWYQIRGPVEIDPGGVLWVCQAFEIKAPAP